MPSAQVTITQLPAAGPITGTESVPIVQNGQTVQTTTGAIAASPSQTQTFLTVNQETTLPNSRALSVGSGLGLTDGGAQSTLQVNLAGAVASLFSSTVGLQAKTSSNTMVGRTIAGSTGVSVTNGNGDSGNPTIGLTGAVGALAGLAGTGILGIVSGSSVTSVEIRGTANEIDVANGTGPGDPTIGIADNPTIPGTGAMILPTGNTAQRPGGAPGQIRYNSQTGEYEAFYGGTWVDLATSGAFVDVYNNGTLVGSQDGLNFIPGNGLAYSFFNDTTNGRIDVTQGLTNTGVVAASYGAADKTLTVTVDAQGRLTAISEPSIAISASQITSGTLPVAQGGTNISSYAVGDMIFANGVTSLDRLAIGAASYVMTSSGTAPQWTAQSGLSVGTATNLAGGLAGSIPYQTGAGATTFLAAGSGVLVGGSTPSYSTAPSLTGTNFSSIPNSALQNSSITIGTTGISLGGTTTTLGGLTSVAVTQNPSSALELATKQYVDGLVSSGITYHTPVKYEVPNSTGNLNAIYNQPGGPGVGVGATLTNNGTLAAFAPDGPTAQVGDRILIYNQTNQFENGVYEVSTVGDSLTPWVLTRTTDADTYALKSTTGLGEGDAFFITSGNTGAGETYVCNTSGTITFGTTAITFVQVSASQVYSAGTGLTLTGTQFSLTAPVVTSLGGTGLTSYTAGDLLYYSTGTALSKLALGTTNYLLSAGVGAPQWSDPAGVTVGNATNAVNATSATTATNVAGGAAGSILYQSGASTTTNLAIGTSTYLLTSSGTAPQWSDPAGVTVGTATTATNANNVAVTSTTTNATFYPAFVDATSGNQAIEVGSGLTFNPSTNTLTTTTFSGSLNGNASTATTATTATNIAGGAANNLLYQTGSGTTSFVNAPTLSNTFLKWTGSGFTWDAAGAGTVTSVDVSGGTTGLTTSGGPVTGSGTITLAGTLVTTNGGTGLSSYTAGDIVYYAAGTALSKLAIGSNTFIMTSSGSAPQWSDPSGITVGNATNATTATTATTATNANNVAVTATTTNATYYPTFVDATTGNNAIEVGTGLTFNPSTNTLTTTTFSGSLSGNATTATTATNATNVATTATNVNATFYPAFVDATTGNNGVEVDTNLTYNPSTNTLTAGTMVATTGIFGGTF